jgi:5-methylcytosine-specific restriction endonuclease McrA
VTCGKTCTCWNPVVRPRDSDDPAEGITYEEYLRTPYWKATSEHARRMFGEICFRCGKAGARHVHHKHYRSLGQEDLLRDIEILCAGCHMKHHRGYKEHRKPSLQLGVQK